MNVSVNFLIERTNVWDIFRCIRLYFALSWHVWNNFLYYKNTLKTSSLCLDQSVNSFYESTLKNKKK